MQQPTLGKVFPIRERKPTDVQLLRQIQMLQAQITVLTTRTNALAAAVAGFNGFNSDGTEKLS